MFNMFEKVDAAKEHHERLLAEAEQYRRHGGSAAKPVRDTAISRHLLIALGNLLIALGTRIKAMPPVASSYDEATNESIG